VSYLFQLDIDIPTHGLYLIRLTSPQLPDLFIHPSQPSPHTHAHTHPTTTMSTRTKRSAGQADLVELPEDSDASEEEE